MAIRFNTSSGQIGFIEKSKIYNSLIIDLKLDTINYKNIVLFLTHKEIFYFKKILEEKILLTLNVVRKEKKEKKEKTSIHVSDFQIKIFNENIVLNRRYYNENILHDYQRLYNFFLEGISKREGIIIDYFPDFKGWENYILNYMTSYNNNGIVLKNDIYEYNELRDNKHQIKGNLERLVELGFIFIKDVEVHLTSRGRRITRCYLLDSENL